MSSDLLSRLKALQHQRGESSPFVSHVEFHIWADNVMPLLSFKPKLQSLFRNSVIAADCSRGLNIEKQEIENINSAIGILNQAVCLLEINPIPNSTSEPSVNPSDNPATPNIWHRPIGTLWLMIIAAVVAAMILYLLRNHLGISL